MPDRSVSASTGVSAPVDREDRNVKRLKLPVDEEIVLFTVEREQRTTIASRTLQEVLQGVHVSLNLLTESRNETNRLLGELIVAVENS